MGYIYDVPNLPHISTVMELTQHSYQHSTFCVGKLGHRASRAGVTMYGKGASVCLLEGGACAWMSALGPMRLSSLCLKRYQVVACGKANR
jgi:hypothetical protein